jgi:hypothetical protein
MASCAREQVPDYGCIEYEERINELENNINKAIVTLDRPAEAEAETEAGTGGGMNCGAPPT